MSTTLPASPLGGAGQQQQLQQQTGHVLKPEQNGCTIPAEKRGVENPKLTSTPVPASETTTSEKTLATGGSGGGVVSRDTSSIPGISMLAGQSYPPAVFKHDEVFANKEVFADALNRFHTVLGTRLTKKGRGGRERAAEVKTFQESIAGIPKLGGNELDLHRLYKEVTSRGGLEQVIKDRKWKEVTNCFKFSETTTSASYVLRKYYVGLLYYFEQAYFFGKRGPLIPPPISMPGPSPMSIKRSDSAPGLTYVPPTEGQPGFKRTRKRKIVPIQAMPVVDPAHSVGQSVQGTIEGKFEHGFLVTVTVGTEKMRGVLYHVPLMQRAPQHATIPNYAATMGAEPVITREEPTLRGAKRRKRRRNEDMPKKDPNAPRPNRTGYNFFFAEQRARLKALHPEKDKELSRMIGDAWNSLTEEEKMPYQDRGVKDKERYKKELREYREALKSQNGTISAELAAEHEPEDEKEEIKEAVIDAVVDVAMDDTTKAAVNHTDRNHNHPTLNVVADDTAKAVTDATDVSAVTDVTNGSHNSLAAAEVEGAAEKSVADAVDESNNLLAGMDVEVELSSDAAPQQLEPESTEALKSENHPLTELTISPYVTPEEETFDTEGLEGEGISEDAFG